MRCRLGCNAHAARVLGAPAPVACNRGDGDALLPHHHPELAPCARPLGPMRDIHRWGNWAGDCATNARQGGARLMGRYIHGIRASRVQPTSSAAPQAVLDESAAVDPAALVRRA
jgi:hypothetical protein